MNGTIPDDPVRVEHVDCIPPHISDAVDNLIHHLDRSVMLRVKNIPRRECVAFHSEYYSFKSDQEPVSTAVGQARVAVFFSGGIDSTMLAFLADRHVVT